MSSLLPVSDSLAMQAFFTRCVESADKVGFTFLDGREFLGWVAEVTDEQVLAMWAPSPMYAQATGGREWNPEDEWVPFTAIRPASLASYDESAGRWVSNLG